jgi:hypothetical protein
MIIWCNPTLHFQSGWGGRKTIFSKYPGENKIKTENIWSRHDFGWLVSRFTAYFQRSRCKISDIESLQQALLCVLNNVLNVYQMSAVKLPSEAKQNNLLPECGQPINTGEIGLISSNLIENSNNFSSPRQNLAGSSCLRNVHE